MGTRQGNMTWCDDTYIAYTGQSAVVPSQRYTALPNHTRRNALHSKTNNEQQRLMKAARRAPILQVPSPLRCREL